MARKIGVLGAGTWGVALARMLSVNGHDVTVWSKFEAEVKALTEKRCHPNLPGMVIPETICFTTDMQAACENKDVLLFAVPSVFVRETAEKAMTFTPDGQVIVDVAKGIEPGTLLTMTEVIRDAMMADGRHDHLRLVALSGPTHAEEVALDMPTSIVSASEDAGAAELVQDVFMNTCLRPYTNSDVRGVELCGALKNIVALASGISEGLGFGDNSRAALITRGMVEITRLGVAMGCNEQTFSGLAGVGDLIVTAMSRHSRNNRAGLLIGQGMKPEDAIRKVGMVVEGVNAIPAARQLAKRYGVEMPIVAGVDAIINHGVDAAEMAHMLMTRDKKAEYVRPAGETADSTVHRVMIYGRFDRMEWNQLLLLKRARTLGDQLIVGLTTDALAAEQGQPCSQPYDERLTVLESLRCVDRVVPQSSLDQAAEDMQAFRIRTLAISVGACAQPEKTDAMNVETIYLNMAEAKSAK